MSPSFCTELPGLHEAIAGWLRDVPLDPACFQHQEQPLTATTLDPAVAWPEEPSNPSSPPPSSLGESSQLGSKRKAPMSHSDSAGPRNKNLRQTSMPGEIAGENPVIVQLEQLTTEMQLPEDVRYMFFGLITICNGFLVLSKSVGEAINARMAIVDPYAFPLSSRNFIPDPTDEAELRSQLAMVGKISAIVRESGMASDRYASEAEWNEWVHRPMLRLGLMAAESPKERLTPDPLYLGVDMFNTKEALITPSCLPAGLDEDSVPDKMINYCIVLSDMAMEAACDAVVRIETERQNRRDGDGTDASKSPEGSSSGSSGSSSSSNNNNNNAKKQPRTPYAINHSEYWPLVGRPLCVSVETHAEIGTGVEELEHVPLALWASAHFVRLRQLQALALVNNPTRDMKLPTLPLLCLVGDDWYILFAVDRGSYMSLLRFPQPVGTTGSIVGCYKILAIIRMLRAWSWNRHRPWWEKLLRDISGLPVEEKEDNEAVGVAVAVA